jgi:translation initiation factor IF-3
MGRDFFPLCSQEVWHDCNTKGRCSIVKESSTRINYKIRADEIRLIGEDGSQLGILPLKDALNRAADVGLDLVEVAPNASPPVCRIMDYGKFKYEQSKKAQEARKKQAYVQIKEIKMRPRTDVHDMEVKKNRIRRFLGEGNKVKVTVRFRGREMAHKHFGFALLEKTVEEMSDIAIPENRPGMEGPTMHIILAPKKD